jgi:hypothetical protein
MSKKISVLETVLWLTSPVIASQQKASKVLKIIKKDTNGAVIRNTKTGRVYLVSIQYRNNQPSLIVKHQSYIRRLNLDIAGAKQAINFAPLFNLK